MKAENRIQNSSLKLAIGTVGSQVAGFLFLAITSRIYTPDQFGTFGLFFTTSQILGLAMALRIDQAIVLSESAQEAQRLKALSLMLATALCVLLYLLLELSTLLTNSIYWYAHIQTIRASIVAGYIVSIQNILSVSAIRHGEFLVIAISRVLKSTVAGVTQVLLAIYETTRTVGLIIGEVVGLLAVVVYLGRSTSKWQSALSPQESAFSVPIAEYVSLVRKYRSLALFNLPQTLINNSTGLVALAIVSASLGQAEAGQFFLMQRIVHLPAGIIASSVAQVYLKSASEEKRKAGAFQTSFLRAIGAPIVIGSCLGVTLYLFGDAIFEYGFGQQWTMAGELSVIYAPYAAIHVVLVAAAPTSLVAQKEGAMFLIGIIQNAVYIAGLIAGISLYGDIRGATLVMVMLSVPYMASMLIIYFRWSR